MAKAARGASSATDVRALYRELAKAVHPDFARVEVEYALRNRFMIEANAAFERGDAAGLQHLLQEWERCQAQVLNETLQRCHEYADELAKQLHGYLDRVQGDARPFDRLGPLMDAFQKWVAALE